MVDMVFVFTAFMVTLGPIKLIPSFHNFTKDMSATERSRLAVMGALIATVISLIIAMVMPGVATSWQVSPDELRIAGGILLFAAAYKVINPGPPATDLQEEPRCPALSPIAIPMIITPWGAAAIMIAMGITANDPALMMTVVANLLLIMLLNLGGMLFSGIIMKFTGDVFWKVLGWVFSVLQAGLAVHIIAVGLGNIDLFASP